MTAPGHRLGVTLSPRASLDTECAVVLLPGIGVPARTATPLAEHLPGVRVVTVGLRPTTAAGLADVRTRAESFAEALLPGRTAERLLVVGHSMGAVVGLELAHVLHRSAPGLVRGLVVAAQVAPHRLPRHGPDHYTDDAVLGHVLGDRPLPPDLAAAPDFTSALVSRWRADYLALDAYRPERGRRVPADLHVWTGADDPVTADPDDTTAWSEYGSARVTTREFPGAHDFLFDDPARTARELSLLLG
ncbi:thioesterase II family protein [Saccharothrix australiensis]|uniref:Surfactin synthase thioesterase subunit n=1 Tax=Saccharothrix australiensis TaxID=2072 RepID=A0A495VZE1_9PSEU|nr:alpha/beta fold hydrolase [Saccharothrix australiensis]RKT54240.1 surfactin synthase thioesterase subunit [Saccharothrix australiensis]